jgi:hypothetical protein
MVEYQGLGFAAASLGTPRTRRKGNRGAEWYEDGDERGRGRKERWVGGDEVRVAGGRRRRCVGRRGDADESAQGHLLLIRLRSNVTGIESSHPILGFVCDCE